MARTKIRSGAKPSENAEKEKPKTEPVVRIERPLMEQMMRVSSGRSSMKDLESLITSFLSELDHSISNKTLETAEKEKQQIKQRLVFFNSTYREIPEPKVNVDYLSKMSDLLAHYVDVEVLTSADPFNVDSREGKDLISRIVTALYSSLESSEDHVLDTMMKLRGPFEENTAKHMETQLNSAKPKKKSKAEDTSKKDVYSELFKIVVKKAQKRQVNDLTYMRYVLVSRLWKKMIKKNTALKEMVIKRVSKLLLPPPFFLKRRWAYKCLSKVLPKPPKNTMNITEFYLREKYNVQKAVKTFLDETSTATQQRTMFLNLSCDPRLLNPKIIEFGPLPPLDAPIQEFSTLMSTADDVWRRLHEEPHSEASVFEQVTNMKKPPTCTSNRVFNLLHSHHLQHKARKAEMKKAALQKACFRGRSVVSGIITRVPGGLSDAYSLSVPNTSSPVNAPVAKPHKRRILDSPDILPHKKNKSDLWEDNHLPIHANTHKRRILESPDNHIPIHTSYVGAGSLRKDNAQLAKVSPFSENPPKSLEETSEVNKLEKAVDLGCNSDANSSTDVKAEVKEEQNGWQSGSSCDLGQSSGDPDRPGKLAIEKEVEQTLQLLQKSKPTIQNVAPPTIETSTVKTENEPIAGRVENSNCVGTNSDVVPDWGAMWSYLGQPQDLNAAGNDVWLDELLSYPSSTGPEGQDFWSLIAGDEIADYS